RWWPARTIGCADVTRRRRFGICPANRRAPSVRQPVQESVMRHAVLAILALLVSATSSWAADVEANKRLYRNLMEDVWVKRQPAAIEKYLAPNFIEHNKNISSSIEGRKQFVAALLAGFSDYRAEIQILI